MSAAMVRVFVYNKAVVLDIHIIHDQMVHIPVGHQEFSVIYPKAKA